MNRPELPKSEFVLGWHALTHQFQRFGQSAAKGMFSARPPRPSLCSGRAILKPARRNRAGFTLIEVLLVTILSAVLMVGLWSLFGTYNRLFESGPKRTERSQLLRALKQQLTDDLHAVIQIPQIPENRTGTMTFGTVKSSATPVEADDSTTATATFSVTPASHSSLPRFGLIGSRQSLKLYVLQTVPGTEGITPSIADSSEMITDAIPAAPELRSILYTFSEPRVMRLGDREAPPGLIRRELDWQTASAESELSEANGDALDEPILTNVSPEELAADNSIAWIPEVTDIQFRYYDGGQWVDDWDSLQRKSLPSAVEVIMVFGTQAEEEADLSDLKSITESNEKENINTDSDLSSEGNLDSDSLLSSQHREPRYRFLVFLPNALSDRHRRFSIGGAMP